MKKLNSFLLEAFITKKNVNSIATEDDKIRLAKKYFSKKILSVIKDFMNDAISDWSDFWDNEDAILRDLETANDWFWNELKNNLGDLKNRLIAGEHNPAVKILDDEVIMTLIDDCGSKVDDVLDKIINDYRESYFN